MIKNVCFMLCAGLAVSGCRADESVAAYGGGDRTWVLQSIDGAVFEARATLLFAEDGGISGQAPCNRYFGKQTAPYPWFEVKGVGSTKMACPDLKAEDLYFTSLSAMTLSEVSGDVLVLSNDQGREMVFAAQL